MSGLDPLAAFALQAVANAQAAIEEATLNLGALLSDFQAKISVGDLLSATVLPPQNGSDRISLLGQTITAQLPPGINPGETIALQVTGFTNTAIVVRNLGSLDAQTPLPQPQQTPASPAQPQSAILRSVPPQTAPAPPLTAPSRAIQPPPAAAAPPRVAPPRELFVAASVRPAQTPAAPAPRTVAADLPEAEPPSPHLEARIAATRASTTIGAPKTTPASVPVSAPAAALRPALQTAQAPRPPEAALLAQLKVPVTATTLAAARLVDTATHALTTAFERLDALLSQASPDPRTVTLRSTLSFVARLDLRSARALPEQIASYVSNVVGGAETKIAQIVRAWSDAAAAELLPQETGGQAAQAPAQAPNAEPSMRTLAPPASGLAAAQLPPPPNVAARAVERTVALEHDVKASLIQLVANPPQGSSPQLIAALRDALTATTAVQLNALNQQNANANAITVPLPAYFYEGGKPAKLQISRDAPNGRGAMDADNFRIAFVLDTQSLGTVAIDVQTVGRAVSVEVKTETPRSADRFRASLVDLRGRLEGLRYRVATMAAGIAPRGAPAIEKLRAAPDPVQRTSNVDAQA